jgi:hypothetical protein
MPSVRWRGLRLQVFIPVLYAFLYAVLYPFLQLIG